jgi:hypothetical protein
MFMFNHRAGSPDTKQTRTRSKHSSEPSSIPESLSNDGLTKEAFTSLVNEYMARRIEPEELMFANLDGDWNSWSKPMFSQRIEGVRFVNEVEVEPDGQFTIVYGTYSSDNDDDGLGVVSPFTQFLNKWTIDIKEKCSLLGDGFDDFWFVVEFSRFEHGRPSIRHIVSLAEGAWYEFLPTNVHSFSASTDFSLRHLGY